MYTTKIQHYLKYNTYTIINYGSSSWTLLLSFWLFMSLFLSGFRYFTYDIVRPITVFSHMIIRPNHVFSHMIGLVHLQRNKIQQSQFSILFLSRSMSFSLLLFPLLPLSTSNSSFPFPPLSLYMSPFYILRQ